MQNREYNYLFKLVIVGNANVGKSSIIMRFADGEFNQTYITTIGVDFRFKSIEVGGKKVKLQIWDTAGQQRFRTITSSYYKGAHALLIAFDITAKDSFADATKYWYNQIKNYCPPETGVLLIGNKSDLQQRRQVTKQSIQQFCNSQKIEYVETSAKQYENIELIFNKISQKLIDMEDAKREQSASKIKGKKKRDNSKDQPDNTKQSHIVINQNVDKKYKICC